MENFGVNIAILGDGAVGKTAILQRWRRNEFPECHVATVSEIFEEKANRRSRDQGISQLHMRIFDTAGSLSFPAMNRLTILRANAFIIVYSVDSCKSFERAKQLRKEVNQIKCCERIPCVIVGNKVDRVESRQVSFDTGLQFAVETKSSFLETSAKDGLHIDDVFQMLLRRYEVLKKLNSKEFFLKKFKRKRKIFSLRPRTKSDSSIIG